MKYHILNLLNTTEFSLQQSKIFKFCSGEVASKHLFEMKTLFSVYQTWTIKRNGCFVQFEIFVVQRKWGGNEHFLKMWLPSKKILPAIAVIHCKVINYQKISQLYVPVASSVLCLGEKDIQGKNNLGLGEGSGYFVSQAAFCQHERRVSF